MSEFLPAPANVGEAMQIADNLAKSELVPSHFRGKPQNVFVAMWWSHNLGISPVQGLQNIAVINGRPCLWGDVALAICKRTGKIEYFKESIEGEGDSMKAVCILKRNDESEEYREEFSVKDAIAAGLWGRNVWKQYPKRMLKLRARGFLLRNAFPESLMGLDIAEEAMDIPSKPAEKESVKMPTRKSDRADNEKKSEIEAEDAKEVDPDPCEETDQIEQVQEVESVEESFDQEGTQYDLTELKKQIGEVADTKSLYALYKQIQSDAVKSELKPLFAQRKKELAGE